MYANIATFLRMANCLTRAYLIVCKVTFDLHKSEKNRNFVC